MYYYQTINPSDKFMRLQVQSDDKIITYYFKRTKDCWENLNPGTSAVYASIQIHTSATHKYIQLYKNERAKFYRNINDPEMFTTLLQQ